MKRSSRLAGGLLALISSLSPTDSRAASTDGYVMGYFKESPKGTSNSHALHLALSQDGLNWVPLNQNNAVVAPAFGTKALRDPHLFHRDDGSWVIVGTDNWESESIHVWLSPDLRTFTEKLVKVSTIGHAWAPETFWDADTKRFGIIWSGKTDRHRIYVTYTTDFSTFAPAQVFFDPGYSVIDAHLEPTYNGTNYLYFKREDNSQMFGARSTSLAPGSFDKGVYTKGYAPTGSGYWASEAPIVMKSNSASKWWLWVDCFIPVNAEFFAFQTSDLAAGIWTPVDKRDYTPPLNAKHATIAALSRREMNDLIAKWGLPKWEIIKSYRSPRAFVRDVGGTTRISSTPFDPTTSMLWKVVPGLADPAGISFESVSYPGQYLRQSSFVVGTATSDNSTAFKSDATFFKVAGFANTRWSSLRSHSYPERYLRSLGDSTLRIDPITSASSTMDKEDATFGMVYADANLGMPTSATLRTAPPTPSGKTNGVDANGRKLSKRARWIVVKNRR